MKVAFVCCTPYHIIMSIHLAETRYVNYQKDIFICDHFNNAYELYNNLKKQDTWNNIYFIKDHDLNYDKSFLRYRKALVSFRKKASYFFDSEFKPDYSELCIFTHNIFSKILYADSIEHNGNLILNFIEEGTSTYTLKNNNKNKFKSCIFKLLNRKIFSNEDISNLLLFKPELYSGDLDKVIIKLFEVDKNNNAEKQIFNSTFNYNKFEIPYENYKFIYFDQTISKDGEIPIDEKKVLFKMIENIESKDLIIKLHPRDSKDKYREKSLRTHSDGNLPWEVIYLNENLDGKTLITIRSSSVFTPKIMFNKENKIILLYKIAGIKDESYENFVDKIRNLYNEDIIYVPETWKDFRETIDYINKNSNYIKNKAIDTI